MTSLIMFGLCFALGCGATVALLLPADVEEQATQRESVSGL